MPQGYPDAVVQDESSESSPPPSPSSSSSSSSPSSLLLSPSPSSSSSSSSSLFDEELLLLVILLVLGAPLSADAVDAHRRLLHRVVETARVLHDRDLAAVRVHRQVEDVALHVDGRDARVVVAVQHLEARLVRAVFRLVVGAARLQPDAVDDVLRRELHVRLVERHHRAEQVERAQVPHLRVGHDLEPVRVEHAGDGLVQLVELVDLLAGRHVPQDTVGEDQLVRRAEGGPIFRVLVVIDRLESGYLLTRIDVVDGGNLHGLLLRELAALDVPQGGHREPPSAGGQQQRTVLTARGHCDRRLVTVVASLRGRFVQVVYLHLARLSSDDQFGPAGLWKGKRKCIREIERSVGGETLAHRKITGGKAVFDLLRTQNAREGKGGVHQPPVVAPRGVPGLPAKRAAKLLLNPDDRWGRGSGHLCGSNRSNGGQVDIGFLQSACWFVRYSVMIVCSVILLAGGACSTGSAFADVVASSRKFVASVALICFCSERCEVVLDVPDRFGSAAKDEEEEEDSAAISRSISTASAVALVAVVFDAVWLPVVPPLVMGTVWLGVSMLVAARAACRFAWAVETLNDGSTVRLRIRERWMMLVFGERNTNGECSATEERASEAA
uniref:Uncharacterized protein n=1 Tax=Anopheles atroparvus TaxID=41427 RepID=A0A182IVT2_ANOAO